MRDNSGWLNKHNKGRFLLPLSHLFFSTFLRISHQKFPAWPEFHSDTKHSNHMRGFCHSGRITFQWKNHQVHYTKGSISGKITLMWIKWPQRAFSAFQLLKTISNLVKVIIVQCFEFNQKYFEHWKTRFSLALF